MLGFVSVSVSDCLYASCGSVCLLVCVYMCLSVTLKLLVCSVDIWGAKKSQDREFSKITRIVTSILHQYYYIILHLYCYIHRTSVFLHLYYTRIVSSKLHPYYTRIVTSTLHPYCYIHITPVLFHPYYTRIVSSILHPYCFIHITPLYRITPVL